MNSSLRSALRDGLLICSALIGVWPALLSAQTVAKKDAAPSSLEPSTKDDTVILSPFVVSTNKDEGYRATNSISGTRLDTAIKDTPMPIEVVTRQFLEDTGATDLRSALKYSSGIILQSQNDLSNRGAGAYQEISGRSAFPISSVWAQS